MNKKELLKFGKGNAKLSKDIATFSLPAGHSCPFAYQCKTSADRDTGKITDGIYQTFRCFAAIEEARFPSIRKGRWRNFDLLRSLKTSEEMSSLIAQSLPKKATKVRVHTSGDFFSQAYFDAWLSVAISNPGIIFYAYTKSLSYWISRLDSIPDNFVLTSSKGGKKDSLIDQNTLRSATVVFSDEEADSLGLRIDHDDSHAYSRSGDFALIIHGVQKKGTKASKAVVSLKKKGFFGYSKKENNLVL